jgi:methylamine dehydrogenase accessory protein MauD
MHQIIVVAQIILIATFAVAGVAKIADLNGSRRAVANFGIPRQFAAFFGILLPITEIIIAITLIFDATAQFGIIGASFLLLIFIGGISYNLVQGNTPDCHCFGQLYSAPIGWATLLRNTLLFALTGIIAWNGPVSIPIIIIGLLLMIGAGIWLIGMFRRQRSSSFLTTAPTHQSTVLARSLPIGSVAPAWNLADTQGNVASLADFYADGRPMLLLFSDPACHFCTELMPSLRSWYHQCANHADIVIMSRGSIAANQQHVAKHGLRNVFVQPNNEVAEAYQIDWLPSALLIRPDGTIGSELALDAEAIAALVRRIAKQQ